MNNIKGIYAASMSVFNENLSLNIAKTVNHAEKIIEQGCHGAAIFGSTGQAQLISISEKINLLNLLSKSKYKERFLIGTGLNSLSETINLMRVASSLNFHDFLIMPPAYYKYGDKEVIEFYSRVIEAIPDSKIILYNFEKLCGYKFSIECVEELVKKFPAQIVGVKDSSYNLYEHLKIDNFSVLPGAESKLLKGLELGCAGVITATCNVTANLSRKVYDDFIEKKEQTANDILCNVRNTFEKLCGYKFSIECVEELVKKLPNQIVGVKDSSYNLYEHLKIDNFSILPGSELKLLKGLELGCAGIITATCNVTANLSRKVYDDFIQKKQQTTNDMLCKVRGVFDKFNLISGLHSFMSDEDQIYKNVVPPISLLNEKDKEQLINDLNKLNFKLGSLKII